jgi:hypothetical protein
VALGGRSIVTNKSPGQSLDGLLRDCAAVCSSVMGRSRIDGWGLRCCSLGRFLPLRTYLPMRFGGRGAVAQLVRLVCPCFGLTLTVTAPYGPMRLC